MPAIAVPERLLETIHRLEATDEPVEDKLSRVLESEIRRRLAQYEMTNRLFQKKYRMSFEEFERRDMVRQLGYSFEAESDHQDWDMAADGIKTLRQELARLKGTP
jgi:hypothetical protein